jgi:hypothetical protein
MGGGVGGAPMMFEPVEVRHDGVRFRRLRRDGALAQEVHRRHRDLFEPVCLGRWVPAEPFTGSLCLGWLVKRTIPSTPALAAAWMNDRAARTAATVRLSAWRPEGYERN